jgi:hypothetical protein
MTPQIACSMGLVAQNMISPFHTMVANENTNDKEESGPIDELVSGNMVLACRPGFFFLPIIKKY